jgi:hypothetical protein
VPIDAETTERGLRAYEQARAFERMGPRLPYGFALAPVTWASGGVTLFVLHHPIAGTGCLMAALAIALMAREHWRRLNLRYRENLALLAKLEAQFGPDLPWLEVERHLQALREAAEEGDD